MPTYHYECSLCQARWEEQKNIAEMESEHLPRGCSHCCASESVTRIFSVPHIWAEKIWRGSGDGFGGNNMARRLAYQRARAAGVSVAGKRYCPSLARFQGDPKAWISMEGTRSEIRERAVDLGWKVNGAVEYTPPAWDETPDEPSGPYRVDDKIVEREVEAKIAEEKWELTPRERADLKETMAVSLSGEQD